MSRKIILTEAEKFEIEQFVESTYQCTIPKVIAEFNVSRNTLVNNFGKDFIADKLFHGATDEKKEKLRQANLGKKQSPEIVEKRIAGMMKTNAAKTDAEKQLDTQHKMQARIAKFGSKEALYDHIKEETRKTKLARYGTPGYNNPEKSKQTKLERYGDPNYNNKEKIKETQLEKYGGYAFENREKYEATMLERYGVKHNWSSKDPKLNGRATWYSKYGSKDEYYKHVHEKGRQTRLELYGNEFYSNSEQAQLTMLQKYGVPFYCMTDECQEKAHTTETAYKRSQTMHENNTFHVSKPEIETLELLQEKFGNGDIFDQYLDDRYSDPLTGYRFKCDFYVKSKDLFIELNLHPTHMRHPFNPDNADDIELLKKLVSNPTPWNKTTIEVWTQRDVLKRQMAMKNNLNYITIYPEDDIYDIICRI